METRTTRARRTGRLPFAVLPLIAALAVGAVGAVTAGSAYLSLASAPTGLGHAPALASTSLADPDHGLALVATWTTLAVVVGGYLVACFTGTLFSAALVATADDRRRGGLGRSADGMRAAALHAPQLLAWSIVAGTIGVVARQFGHRGVVGITLGNPTRRDWNDATALVLPLIVLEGLGPHAAWRRSRRLAPARTHLARPEVRHTTTTPSLLALAVIAGALIWPIAPVAAATAMAAVVLAVYVSRATATGMARTTGYHEAVTTEAAANETAASEVAGPETPGTGADADAVGPSGVPTAVMAVAA